VTEARPAVVLYDGACRFCVASSARLLRWAKPGALVREDFRAPGVLDRFPGVTAKACERAMQLVLPDGRVFAGAEAIARALVTRPVLGLPARLYFVPGLRQLADFLYRFVARNRFRIAGRATTCEGGACRLR
jgi:predicted DCC family thiol-disulfide oxidoreductase YuxK